MTLQQLQELILHDRRPSDMLAIAEAYLGEGPIEDPIAAEAWLMQIIDSEDPIYSPRAMVLLGQKILQSEVIISAADVESIRRHLDLEKGEKERELQNLLNLARTTEKHDR